MTVGDWTSHVDKAEGEESGSLWVIPREVAQENPRPPSILMKIDKPIVPHDRNMYAQF